MANPIFYLGETAENKTISVRYLFKHLLKTKMDYLRLILGDFFTNLTGNIYSGVGGSFCVCDNKVACDSYSSL